MDKEQAEKITKEIAMKAFNGYLYTRGNFDLTSYKLDCELLTEIEFACKKAYEAALTATSVKVPSDEEIEKTVLGYAGYTESYRDGFKAGANWAIKRMQEEENEC
jgi:hypothetical protein